MTKPFSISTPLCVSSDGHLTILECTISQKDGLRHYDTLKLCKGTTLSMSAHSAQSFGQMHDTILNDMAENPDKVESHLSYDEIKELIEMWQMHHLNDLTPHSKAQEKQLEKLRLEHPNLDLQSTSGIFDNKHLLDESQYSYGSAHLYRPIPKKDLERIKMLCTKAFDLNQERPLKGNLEKLIDAFQLTLETELKRQQPIEHDGRVIGKQDVYECHLKAENPFLGKTLSATFPFFQAADEEPVSLTDFLDSLSNDLSTALNYESDEQGVALFAEDYGFNPDSPDDLTKAQNILENCHHHLYKFTDTLSLSAAKALAYDDYDELFIDLEELDQNKDLSP